ncbi:MAG: histidine phosphatase family protein [Saprospiraceae bacterium]|nr:histidine phosphatase family protein [Saprospiraceae bacterium]
MKTVFFIRHAKSSWSDKSLKDIERPLNKRGLSDAPMMAKHLSSLNLPVDALISSPAKRAFSTATYFAKALDISENQIIEVEQIYEADVNTILHIIRQLDNRWSSVLLFGHNPTFTLLANLFHHSLIDNVPTCGIVQVNANINDWAAFNSTTGVLKAFYYPKQFK